MKIEEIDRSEYDAFLSQTSGFSIYHSSGWVESVANSYATRVSSLAVIDGNKTCAVFPVYFRSRLALLRLAGSPLPEIGTPPTSIAFDTKDSDALEILIALDEWRRKQGITYFQAALPVHNADALAASGYSPEIVDNLELSLDCPIDEVWRGVKRKSKIDKAREAGVESVFVAAEDAVENYVSLLHSTYQQTQNLQPNFPIALYENLTKNLIDNGLTVFGAKLDGHVVSMLWILHDQDRCYFWDGASNQAVSKDIDVNRLLHWEVMKWGHEKGLKIYDLVGRSEKSGRSGLRPGIARFKKTLGAKRVDYLQVKLSSPAFNLGVASYRHLLTLRNRLRSRTGEA